MYLSFVDESGDVGTANSPSRYFVLSGIVLHERDWTSFLNGLVLFRRRLRERYKLQLGEEIHASEFIVGKPELLHPMPSHVRLDLLKQCLRWLNGRPEVNILTVCLKKECGGDIFELAWLEFLRRFDEMLKGNHFTHSPWMSDRGMVLSDNTNGGKLTRLIRQMRRQDSWEMGTSRLPLLERIIEDPVFRDSRDSYIHQMVDVVAYFARQYYEPNRFVRRKGARTFYGILDAVVNKHFSQTENCYHHIVEV